MSSEYARSVQKRDPRRSTRSSRGSRMLGSTTSTSLSPEILTNGSPKVRFALLHKKNALLSTPLKTVSEGDAARRLTVSNLESEIPRQSERVYVQATFDSSNNVTFTASAKSRSICGQHRDSNPCS